MNSFVRPNEPLKVALIGAGQRSRTVYAPLLPWLTPWVQVVAVCDPVREHADNLAKMLDVPAFYDIRDLVKARPMEAAIVVTPIPSHHSISVYLSSHGVHNLVETSWCSMIIQARDMIETAKKNNVLVRVAENFFRFPIDRLVQAIKANGFLGDIKRIVSYNDHTGFHNNSRWIVFAGSHPTWVQSVEHTMPTVAFHSTPERFHQDETYRARFFWFADNLLVMDHAANIKGFLGRQMRPGLTEWQGARGTVVWSSPDGKTWTGVGEVRYLSDVALPTSRGIADQVFPIIMEQSEGQWDRIYVDLPVGRLGYDNRFMGMSLGPTYHRHPWYGVPVAEHIVDFALAVKGLRPSEFNEHDALMSLMMEIGARESALHEGRRLALPLSGDLEADSIERAKQKSLYGVDPMDVEAMLAISYPKP